MDIDTETLIAGLLSLGYVLYGPLVKGGFGNKIGPTKEENGFPLQKGQFFSYQ